MKQILQDLKVGHTKVENIPTPQVKPGHLLIQTRASLVSAGTERMLVEFGKANLIEKARQQPDKVKMVLDKVKTDGFRPTLEAVRNKLDQPLPMGYCNAGVVLEVGSGVTGFSIGDRVASNGKHAEIVCIPKNLCAKVPEGVPDEAAAFTVIGAIGLQGIRLLQPTLGEAVVVMGLGLIGLISVQLLRAHGCRVLGMDYDKSKLDLARQFGADTLNLNLIPNPINIAQIFSRGRGVDGVLITASTKSNDPVHHAAQMCRKRGRIVLVGVTGLELSRADFYEKELSFQVSCSYGPGRYDNSYEEEGKDYPIGFVRWTEQRNFEAILDKLAEDQLQVASLISHRFSIQDASQAYELVSAQKPSLGIILNYSQNESLLKPVDDSDRIVRVSSNSMPIPMNGLGVGFIGAGNYATQVLIPAFQQTGAVFKSIATTTGVSGTHAAQKYGFHETTTDALRLIQDESITTIVITTRHDSHAQYVCESLKAGKHVFVEKPLAITCEQLARIQATYSSTHGKGVRPIVMVGFNRRFSPQIIKIRSLLSTITDPKVFVMTINAGAIPDEHWTQHPSIGGGRLIGEGCHFIDLLRHLTHSPITAIQGMMMGKSGGTCITDDKVSISLTFADGSIGTIHYLANGHKSFPKERLEVFCGGRILQLDNFRKLTGFGWPGFKKMNLWNQDKGNVDCARAFIHAIQNQEPSPIPFQEIVEVTQASLDVVVSMRK